MSSRPLWRAGACREWPRSSRPLADSLLPESAAEAAMSSHGRCTLGILSRWPQPISLLTSEHHGALAFRFICFMKVAERRRKGSSGSELDVPWYAKPYAISYEAPFFRSAIEIHHPCKVERHYAGENPPRNLPFFLSYGQVEALVQI